MPTEAPATSVVGFSLVTPNGEDLEGAPWSLYTTSASQAGVAPYLTGFVSAGNRLELVNLPPARYRLVVQPIGFAQVEFTFATTGTSTEYDVPVFAQIAPTPVSTATTPKPSATTAVATATSPSTVVPTATTVANPTVSALPATGTSGSGSTPMLLMITTSVFVALIVAALGIRRNDAK